MSFLQEVENWEVISLLRSYRESNGYPNGYTENPKSPLSCSDLKRAFQYLGGVEMNLTNSRLMMILVLSFMGFLRFSEVSHLKRSDFIIHNTHMSIFIEKSKTDTYRKGHWLHLAKLNSNLCPLDLTKRHFVLAGVDKQYDKYIFRGIENTKNGLKLRKIDNPLSYTTVRGNVLDLLANIGLDPKKFGLHGLRSGGTSAAANLGVNERLFKKHGRWKSDKVKDSFVHEDMESKLLVSRNLVLYSYTHATQLLRKTVFLI